MPPPLVEEYRQIAAVVGRPEDPEDFPGYHAAMDDSLQQNVVDLTGDDDDDSDLGFDDDLGDVDDD